MKAVRLICCVSILLVCSVANVAAGRSLTNVNAATKTKHLPALKETAALVSSSLGQGVLIIGTFLALVCGPMGCSGTDIDEAEPAVTQVVPVDTSSEDAEGGAYKLSDYLGKYIAYVGNGDGSISTAYVTSYTSTSEQIIIQDEADDWKWEEEEKTISLNTVVGVMHQAHTLTGEEVSFKRVHGAMPLLWGDDPLPDRLYGTVDVVYIAAILPEGSGEPTAVGVTVHSGDSGEIDARRFRVHLPYTVFLPIGRATLIDASK